MRLSDTFAPATQTQIHFLQTLGYLPNSELRYLKLKGEKRKGNGKLIYFLSEMISKIS